MSEPVMRALRTLHRWIGLILAVPLMTQGTTGFILAITPPFESLRLPQSRPFEGPPHGIGAIVAAARSAAPSGLVPLRYQIGPTDHDTATVDLAPQGQRTAEARVFVDPGSLAILDWRDRPDDFYRVAHGLHETMLISGPLGHDFVGWSGLGLLCLGLSGITIWWPRLGRWRAAFSVNLAANGYRFHRALHGAAGGWLVALLILQSLSGASMAFPGVFGAILGAPPAKNPVIGSRTARGANPPMPIDLDSPSAVDALVGAARIAVPEATVTSLRFPTQPSRPMIATLDPNGRAEGAPPVVVLVDPRGGQVVSVRDPRQATLGATILAWLRVLHSGEGLGPAWRAIICFLGLALPLFPITGIAMWLSRRRRLAGKAILQGASE